MVAELTRTLAEQVAQHFRTGNHQTCLELSEIMLRLKLDYPRLHWLRAQCYLKLGDSASAQKEICIETAEWPWIPEKLDT